MLLSLTRFALLILLLNGCAQLHPTYKSAVAVHAPAKLEFTGRGSAAAFMLSGTMGAAGIAIGTAIDIGLAKEAEQGFAELGYRWQGDLKKQLEATGHTVVDDAEQTLVIRHIGFKAQGEDVVAWLEVSIALGKENSSFEYVPEESISFREFKSDHMAGVQLLSSAIRNFVEHL